MSEADGGAPRPVSEPAGLWSPPYRLLTAGLLLVVAAAAFESLAVATILPLVVGDLGGLALYGWAFSLFTLANLLGIALGGSATDRRGPAPPLAAGIGVFLVGLVGGGPGTDHAHADCQSCPPGLWQWVAHGGRLCRHWTQLC